MTIDIHRAGQRGVAEHGWLSSRFSFSFAEYRNPDRMGFGALRVINDDVIAPGTGFGMHPHRDMEIITVVTRGAVRHEDSEGHRGVTREGQIQYMRAGSGIRHSEVNPSESEPLELFQIWIEPSVKGLAPYYEQRDFSEFDDENRWVTLVSPDGREGSMAIKQDAYILTARIDPGVSLVTEAEKTGHGRLVFVVEGEIFVNEHLLMKRDEAQIREGEAVVIRANKKARVMLFEVPMDV